MQEIVILLSSLAGVATAAAVRKMPRNKTQLLSLGASSHIKSQIRTLNIEKEILTKTISRLYQTDSEFSKIQRDKLLVKYQHQLGIILAKLEKLEQASQHPDLGPVGDGLITLMDQKLSKLDDRLYELSSKIATVDISVPEIKSDKPEINNEVETKENKISFSFEKSKSKQDPIIIPPRKRQSFELTTLTKLSRNEPKFPSFETQNGQEKIQVKPIGDKTKQIIESEQIQVKPISQEIVKPSEIVPEPEIKLDTKPDITKEVAKITKHKALPPPAKPKPVVLDEDFDDDSDSDDLDKIKGEIMSVLSKLDQAEVE